MEAVPIFANYDVDHTPHCRPRATAQTRCVMATFALRSNVESTTRPWRRADYIITSRFARGSVACRAGLSKLRHLCRSLELENASLWPLGPGNLVCTHGTTILTNRESSELVGEHIIFYALQKIVTLKNIFHYIVYHKFLSKSKLYI